MGNVRPGRRWSLPVQCLALGVAYYALAQLSYRVAFHPDGSLAVWWAPSGVALFALVRAERRALPWLLGVIAVVSSGVNLAQPIGMATVIIRSLSDCLEPLAGAWLLRRFVGRQLDLGTMREVGWFAVAGGLVGPTLGALVIAFGAVVWPRAGVPAGLLAAYWWGSAALGAMIFSPVLFTWRSATALPRGRRAMEAALLFLSLLVISVSAYLLPARSPPALLNGFAAFPLLAWAAVRFGPAGTARAAVALSLLSLWPFFTELQNPQPWKLIISQGIYSFAIFTSLALAALAAETQRLRTRAEEHALRAEESLALLESALSGAPFAIAFFDRALHLIRTNGVFAELAGRSHAKLAGTPLREALPEAAAHLSPLLHTALAGGGPVESMQVEVETGGRNGTRRAWLSSAFPVWSRNEEPIAAGLLMMDMSERKAEEEERARLYREAEEAVKVREDFLSIASHELKTPLTPIAARLRFLQRKLEAGEPIGPESIERPMQSLRKLTELINDLLDASRIEHGRLLLHLQPQQLNGLVRQIAEPFRDLSPLHQILLILPDEPLWVSADPERLTQVLGNLIDNAIKYSPSGGRIEIRLRPHPDGVELTVTDEGIGISKEQHARLFERFYRTTTSTRSYGGLGLGLYITRDIVDRHGGRIWVESAPGAGSTFHVVLPRLSGVEVQEALH